MTQSPSACYAQVIVFDNKSTFVDESSVLMDESNSDEYESGAAFLIRILRYLETPQYLRKSLFPKHNSLRFVVMPQFCNLDLHKTPENLLLK